MKGRHGKLIQRCSSLLSKPRIAILRHICLETKAHREAVFADTRCISWHTTPVGAVGTPWIARVLHQMPLQAPIGVVFLASH